MKSVAHLRILVLNMLSLFYLAACGYNGDTAELNGKKTVA